MKNSYSISWAILACNETDSLWDLLTSIRNNANAGDEIVVVLDSDKVTIETMDVVDKFFELVYKGEESEIIFKYSSRPLNNSFCDQKNYMNSHCECPYIFNVDADEMLPDTLIQNAHVILSMNPTVEAFWIPRINTVEGITKDHIKRWRWVIDDQGRINYPDPQLRLYKNLQDIKWMRDVHEFLSGFSKFSQFPLDDNYSIIHNKKIERQEAQNKFYYDIMLKGMGAK